MIVDLNKRYRTSQEVIAREIEGEMIIVPLKSGLGDLNSELYGLSTTGLAVWQKLKGDLSLKEVIQSLSAEYEESYDRVKKDVLDLVEALKEKGLVVEL